NQQRFQTNSRSAGTAAELEGGPPEMPFLNRLLRAARQLLLHADELKEKLARGIGNAGDDAGHDDKADSVPDSVFVDLFPNPHHEDCSGRHGHDGRQYGKEAVVIRENLLVKPTDIHVTLNEANKHGSVASVFVDLFPA